MADYISKYETGAAVDAALDLAMSALQPESGKGLSTNDFTNEYKDKVDSNDAEISSARGSYTTVNDRLNTIDSEQESQGAALDEDREALVEIVDSGAKNVINNAATTRTESGVTFTVNADGTVELSGTASATIWFPIMTNFSISAGIYTISNGLTDDTARVIISPTNSLSSRIFDSNESGYVTRAIDVISGVNAYLRIENGRTTDGAVVKPMLCTKAAWDISQEYQQYIPSNEELAENKVNAILTAIPSGVSLADFANSLPVGVHHCFYNSTNNAPDVPVSAHGYVEIHKYSAATGDMTFNPISMAYQVNKYRKILIGGVWRNWVVFTGAELEAGA